MGFIAWNPHRACLGYRSSQSIIEHAWQQIESQTLLPGGNDFVDFASQAKSYFVDACKADWRSAGLLYYYSFLNLAKVVLVDAGTVSHDGLVQSAAYHGLGAEQQTPANLADFEFEIFPPRPPNGRINIFALLYEALLEVPWPFQTRTRIRLRDVIPYCLDIAVEANTHFDISPLVAPLTSLIRSDAGEFWFELLVPSEYLTLVMHELVPLDLNIAPYPCVTGVDANDWLLAHGKTRMWLRGCHFLRSPRTRTVEELAPLMARMQEHSLAHVAIGEHNPWWFVAKINLPGASGRWHPLLSDYLFAFCLSTILRYQPYLLKRGTPDQFLAEAWCRQSPSTVLRYVLMALTDPAMVVGTVD